MSDATLRRCRRYGRKHGGISTAQVQRAFGFISYTRAARIMDALIASGVVGDYVRRWDGRQCTELRMVKPPNGEVSNGGQ